MGWTFTHQSREQLVRTLIQPNEGDRASMVTLEHTLINDVLWSVVRMTAHKPGLYNLVVGESVTFIRCDLLEGSADGWGYKAMDESVHPYYYSCPLHYLDLAPIQSADWREGVRAFHAANAYLSLPSGMSQGRTAAS